MQQPPSILVYGREPGLLLSRTWVLQAAGFHAQPAGNLCEARKAAGSRAVDLLVLCHTLSSEDCRDALTWADSLPGMKRIVLTSGATSASIPPNEVVLSQFAGARELVAVTQRLLPTSLPD